MRNKITSVEEDGSQLPGGKLWSSEVKWQGACEIPTALKTVKTSVTAGTARKTEDLTSGGVSKEKVKVSNDS